MQILIKLYLLSAIRYRFACHASKDKIKQSKGNINYRLTDFYIRKLYQAISRVKLCYVKKGCVLTSNQSCVMCADYILPKSFKHYAEISDYLTKLV